MFNELKALDDALQPLRDPQSPAVRLLAAGTYAPAGGSTELHYVAGTDAPDYLMVTLKPVNDLRDRVGMTVTVKDCDVKATVQGRHSTYEAAGDDLKLCIERVTHDLNLIAQAAA
jgi:hypothetical protein